MSIRLSKQFYQFFGPILSSPSTLNLIGGVGTVSRGIVPLSAQVDSVPLIPVGRNYVARLFTVPPDVVSEKGIDLSHKQPLPKAPEKWIQCPARMISKINERLRSLANIKGDEEISEDLMHITISRLWPAQVLQNFNEVEIALLTFSTGFSLPRWEKEVNESVPLLRIIKKIELASWRAHSKSLTWNQVVDIYNRMITFDLGMTDLTMRIDLTSDTSRKGYSSYCDVFLDSELGFVFFHQDRHVFSIGFNAIVREGRLSLRIEQVQLRQKKGNRFLYKMGGNYFQFVLERLVRHFAPIVCELRTGEHVVRDCMATYQSEIDFIENQEHPSERDLTRLGYFQRSIQNLQGEEGERIAQAYNQDFKGLKRSEGSPGYWRISPI